MIDKVRVIREVREAADMDHPWIPGARADLIRDVATLLEVEPSLAEVLASLPDLGSAVPVLARETVIRNAMAETGESREIVTEMLDATVSMDQETVLELTDGRPTTLRAGLARYVDSLEALVTNVTARTPRVLTLDEVIGNLGALLAYPWPGSTPELEILSPDGNDDLIEIRIGGRAVFESDYDTLGYGGMDAVKAAAKSIHEALLEAVTRA